MHQNISGVLNKQELLESTITDLEKNGWHIDVVCLSETNILRGSENNLKLRKFQLAAHYSRKHSKRGGVAILVGKHLHYTTKKEIVSLAESYVFECCAVTITQYNLVVICVYTNKTPTSASSLFFHKLEELLHIVCQNRRKKYILCGDFNIDTLKKNSQVSRALEQTVNCYGLKLIINGPTRITNYSETCIDHIATNVAGGEARILDLGLSDHTAQSFHIPVKKRVPPPVKWWYVTKRDYNQVNQLKFVKCLSSLSFHDVLTDSDAKQAFRKFYELYLLFYNLCFPVIRVKVINNSFKSRHLTKGLRNCCRKKRQLYLLCRKSKQHKLRYKTYTRLLKRCILSHQKAENLKYINKIDNKCKAVWNIIKQYGSTDCNSRSVDSLLVDNKYIVDPQEIAEHFNNYFIDIVTSNITSNTTNDINIDNNELTIFPNPLSVNELIKIISSLKNSTAVGYDDLRTDIIKKSMFIIAAPLAHVINLSLAQGFFPDELKKSVVNPLFKKGEKSDMGNHRPVTLVSVFAKIYEKVMYNRMITFFEKTNVINEEQHGFRKSKSTSLATFKLVKSVIDSIDSKIPVTVLFMDMSKAFDFVCHKRLIAKLSRYGIRGPTLEWIKSYLSNRNQCVETQKYCEKSKTIKSYRSSYINNGYGVPQGSILGPLLFLMYINDLPNYLNHECILFADDTSIIIKCKDLLTYNDDINLTLTQTINWLERNNLKVNLNKTNFIQFHTDRSRSQNLNVQFNNDPIEEVKYTRFLGIIIDCHCKWKEHIDKVCSKVNSFVFALKRISQTVSIQAALIAYHGYVGSILRYCIIIWGNGTTINQIFIAQKRCIRAIFGIKRKVSCRPYFMQYKILTVACLYISEVCIFVHKYKNLFTETQAMYSRNARLQYKYKLYKPVAKLALTSKNTYMMCVTIYNKLPDVFKSKNLKIFRKMLLTWLYDKCFYSISEYLNE